MIGHDRSERIMEFMQLIEYLLMQLTILQMDGIFADGDLHLRNMQQSLNDVMALPLFTIDDLKQIVSQANNLQDRIDQQLSAIVKLKHAEMQLE